MRYLRVWHIACHPKTNDCATHKWTSIYSNSLRLFIHHFACRRGINVDVWGLTQEINESRHFVHSPKISKFEFQSNSWIAIRRWHSTRRTTQKTKTKQMKRIRMLLKFDTECMQVAIIPIVRSSCHMLRYNCIVLWLPLRHCLPLHSIIVTSIFRFSIQFGFACAHTHLHQPPANASNASQRKLKFDILMLKRVVSANCLRGNEQFNENASISRSKTFTKIVVFPQQSYNNKKAR